MPLALSPASLQSLHTLCWNTASGGMFALDVENGELINVNPAGELLSGHSLASLLGLPLALLHPESEREKVKTELLRDAEEPSFHTGFHIQHKDGSILPVMIRSSQSLLLDDHWVKICIYLDITDLEQREHQLMTKRWALSAYAGAALALGRQHTTESLLEDICAAITQESAYVLACVGIAEDDLDKRIRVVAASGNALSYLDGLDWSWSEEHIGGHSTAGRCIRSQTMQIMEDSEVFPGYEPFRDRARRNGIRSSMAIPIVCSDPDSKDGVRRAALIVYASRPHAFVQVVVEVFQHLAEQVSHGIHAIEQEHLLRAERARMTEVLTQLTVALSAMITPIVTAMEMRDPYTAGHQSRVSEIAVAISREMGWPEDKIQGLRIAASVHDVGKISIPAEILTKPSRLTGPEWAMLREHPETGYTILKDIPFVLPVAEIVRQHHEKLDGSGYPFGLKGDDILPEAQVLAVADIAEAMASNRPYRQGIDLSKVLETLESQAGTQLNAEMVRICVDLFKEKRLVMPGLL